MATSSVAALLLAGAAHAVPEVSPANIDGVANEVAVPFNIPVEVVEMDQLFNAWIEFEVSVAPLNIAGGTNIIVDVLLDDANAAGTQMAFDPSNLPEGTGALTLSAVAGPNIIQHVGNSGTGNLLHGGGVGDTFARILYEVEAVGTNSIGLRIPVHVNTANGCPSNATISVNMYTDAAGDPIGGTFNAMGNRSNPRYPAVNPDVLPVTPTNRHTVFTCDGTEAFNLAAVTDEATSDTYVTNEYDYTRLAEWDPTGNVQLFSNLLESIIGTIQGTAAAVNPVLGLPNAIGMTPTPGPADTIVQPAATPGTAGQITNVAWDVTLTNPPGFGSASSNKLVNVDLPGLSVDCAAFGAGLSSACSTAVVADIDLIYAGPEELELIATGAGTGVIARQNIIGENLGVSFGQTVGQDLRLRPSSSYADGDLDGLEYDGVHCGVFRWFADGQGTGSLNHVIRVTGLPGGAGDAIGYAVELRNTNTGDDGIYFGQLRNSATRQGDLRINSNHVRQDVGAAFGTADANFWFFVSEDFESDGTGNRGFAEGALCNRLIAQTGGIVTDFGDSHNYEGYADNNSVDFDGNSPNLPSNTNQPN